MNTILANLKYHAHCMSVWEKLLQDRPLTDDEIKNFNDHKRLYRELKEQLINPMRYRLRAENTLSGYVSYSEWFDSEYRANDARHDLELAEEICPFMIFTIEQSSTQ